MVKKLSKEKKGLAKFVKAVNNIEVKSEEMETLSLKIHEVYANVIKKYLENPAVIQFNYLDNLKGRTKQCKTPEEFAEIVSKDIEIMEAKTEKSRIEEIEFAIAKKVFKDVVQGKGKEFEYGKDLSFKYDDQDVRFVGYFDAEKAKEEVKNTVAS